jgi:hypothetical protein
MVLAVQPSCRNERYWQVHFDTNRAIDDVGAAARHAVPERRVASRSLNRPASPVAGPKSG